MSILLGTWGVVTYHERCKVLLVLLSLDAEVLKVEVTVRVRLDRDNLETSHDGRLRAIPTQNHYHMKRLCSTHSRVGSMGTGGNQADIPMSLTA